MAVILSVSMFEQVVKSGTTCLAYIPLPVISNTTTTTQTKPTVSKTSHPFTISNDFNVNSDLTNPETKLFMDEICKAVAASMTNHPRVLVECILLRVRNSNEAVHLGIKPQTTAFFANGQKVAEASGVADMATITTWVNNMDKDDNPK